MTGWFLTGLYTFTLAQKRVAHRGAEAALSPDVGLAGKAASLHSPQAKHLLRQKLGSPLPTNMSLLGLASTRAASGCKFPSERPSYGGGWSPRLLVPPFAFLWGGGGKRVGIPLGVSGSWECIQDCGKPP